MDRNGGCWDYFWQLANWSFPKIPYVQHKTKAWSLEECSYSFGKGITGEKEDSHPGLASRPDFWIPQIIHLNRIFSINHPFWIPLFMETLVYLWVCGYFRNWIYYYGYPPFKGHGEAWNMFGSCFGRFLIGFLDRNSKVIFVANVKFHPWKKDPDCHTLRSGTSSDLCCQDVQQVVKWMASAFLHGRWTSTSQYYVMFNA